MEDPNKKVRNLLEQLIESGKEIGLQVAAYLDGQLVIDVCAGVADPATGRTVEKDTLFAAASCTKGITATCIHILADRKAIDYDLPIANIWPEFAAHGKDQITIRHALTHQAGIPQMPDNVTPEMMCDWDAMCTAIADLPPLWEAGKKTGYHALTFGWILGEVVRRADGRPISVFLQDEICKPLGIKDLYLGIPDEVEDRVANTSAAPPPPDAPVPPPDLLFLRAIPLVILMSGFANRPDTRRASIPAGLGIMTAQALARHYAALAQGGELDGTRILSPESIGIATQLQTEAYDEVVGPIPGYPQPVRKALGYWLGGPRTPADSYHAAMGDKSTTFGHPGAGGMIAFADPEQRFSFAFLKNYSPPMGASGPDSAYTVAQSVRTVLGLSE
ncbi:MAG: beta-lactamase family protein [Desulfobacteraceae bacterium]|nr:beta-lactamase family protein [Desulfobacteraceae bacterium]